MTILDTDLRRAAERAAAALGGRSLACAESCTAGILTQAFAAVEGSGDWFRGGIVAYQRRVKTALLDVRPDEPLVTEAVAEQMARAVAKQLEADVAVATTGAAGPDPLDGARPGTVVIGLFVNGSCTSVRRFYDDENPERVVEHAALDAATSLAAALETAH